MTSRLKRLFLVKLELGNLVSRENEPFSFCLQFAAVVIQFPGSFVGIFFFTSHYTCWQCLTLTPLLTLQHVVRM